MYALSKFFHLAGAIVWLGGMAFTLWALRPAAVAVLQPPERVPLLAAVLRRFFVLVWISIALLAASGLHMLAMLGMQTSPIGTHAMLTLGLVMMAVFAHIYFGPYRRLGAAALARDWPESGRQLARIQPLVLLNFALGWLAILAVLLLR